ncbi:unnamed protein product, partial [Ascophyllum nodosum]
YYRFGESSIINGLCVLLIVTASRLLCFSLDIDTALL